MQNWLIKSEAAPRINAMLDLARSEPGVPVLPEDMDRDPWLLNCINGTVDLRTGELRPHCREDTLTKLCPTSYDPDASAPTFQRFMNEIFASDGDLIDYLQRLFGYCLCGDTREHLLVVCHGSGANGKSVLLNLIMAVMGEDYATTAMPDLLLARQGGQHPTEIANLFGKRLLVCQEAGAGRRLNESLVKWLSGGDKLQARRMREDFWEFDPTHKAFIIGNHRPEVRGTDIGIWRRLRLIPFNVTFSEDRQDKQLPEKLLAEAPGVLAWMVRGCLEWQRRGMLTPKSVIAATESYRAEEDFVTQFIAECCIKGPEYRVRSSALYERFSDWQEKQGECKVPSRKAFGAAMTLHGFEREESHGVWYRGLTDSVSGQ
jgi:putative DNA primase/helicase